MLIPVRTAFPRLAQAARDAQKVIREQAVFYRNPMKSQLIKTFIEAGEAVSTFVDFSENIQTISLGHSDLETRQTAAAQIEQLSQQFNRYYVTARELSEEGTRLCHSARMEAMSLSRQLDVHCRHLDERKENTIAIMTAIDLLEETLAQTLDQWLDTLIKTKQDTTAFKLRQHRVTDRFYCYSLLIDNLGNSEQIDLMSAIDRHHEQRTQLYFELNRINSTLTAVKAIESQIKQYAQRMAAMSAAMKSVAVNWGKISNDFAIQAHQLGARSDSNQLFKMLAGDIPVASYYWRQLDEQLKPFKPLFVKQTSETIRNQGEPIC